MTLGKKNRKYKHQSRQYSAFIQSIFNFINISYYLVYMEIKNVNINYSNYYCCYKNYLKENTIKQWKYITNIQKLSYIFYFMIHNTEYKHLLPFSLDISNDFMQKCKNMNYRQAKAKIRNKITSNLLHKLGYIPRCLFVIENKNRQFHIHGLIEVNPLHEKEIRDSLKVSGFGCHYNKLKINRFILKINKYSRKGPIGWLRYINKDKTAGDSLYISTQLRKEIKEDYMKIYDCYRDFIIEALKSTKK